MQLRRMFCCREAFKPEAVGEMRMETCAIYRRPFCPIGCAPLICCAQHNLRTLAQRCADSLNMFCLKAVRRSGCSLAHASLCHGFSSSSRWVLRLTPAPPAALPTAAPDPHLDLALPLPLFA